VTYKILPLFVRTSVAFMISS